MYRTFVLLTNSDSEGHRFDFCRAYRRKSPRKCKASGDFCAFFPKALLSTTYFPVPMEKIHPYGIFSSLSAHPIPTGLRRGGRR